MSFMATRAATSLAGRLAHGPSAVIDLTAGRVRTVNGSEELRSIENAVGTNRGDTLIGNAVANVLFGGRGDDQIEGRDGDDSLGR